MRVGPAVFVSYHIAEESAKAAERIRDQSTETTVREKVAETPALAGAAEWMDRVGINLDTSPTRQDLHHHHRRNILAFNDVGVAFMPAVRNNRFESNAFVENIENVAIMGGGAFEGQNSFTVDGRGNYWSDYRGFDLDADGVGDIEYRATGLFEDLMDREPKLRFFLFSPAQQVRGRLAEAEHRPTAHRASRLPVRPTYGIGSDSHAKPREGSCSSIRSSLATVQPSN